MRTLGLLLSFMMIASCYAYKMMTIETNIPQESLTLQETVDARLPANSMATVGLVTRHKLDISGLSYPIFIIGNDEVSRQWLAEHAEELRELKALGFVTNIESSEAYEELQSLAGTPLLPANVDDLLALLKTSHYPLVFNRGEVWQ